MSEPCQHGRDAETCAFCANERADQDRIRALEARVKELTEMPGRFGQVLGENATLKARVKELEAELGSDWEDAKKMAADWKARAEKAEADLAALHPFIEFVQSMREAMERHHVRVPSDSMEPWIQHKGPTLRRALRGEFDEWENSLIHGGDEVKELVDTATCSFFVWRFLQRAAGRESGSLASGKQKTPGEASQDPTGTGVSAKSAARHDRQEECPECGGLLEGGHSAFCGSKDGCGT